MKVLRYPIFGITCFFVFGILFDFYCNPNSTVLLLSLAISFVLFCLSYFASNRHFQQKNYFGLTLYFLSFCCGSLTQHFHYEPNHRQHYSHFITDKPCSIKGAFTERLKSGATSDKYLFAVSEINNHHASGTLLLYIPKTVSLPKSLIGTRLALYTTLSELPKNRNPYQFDYAAYMAKRNVFHQLYLSKTNFIITGQQQNGASLISKYRDQLLFGFEKHHFKPETQAIITALILGQRQDLDSNTTSAYTDAGAAHILAISGLHIALLYGLLLFLVKPLKRLQNGRILQFIILLLLLWLYAILTGLSASVVRAVTLFSLISFSRYLNRATHLYNSLIISFFLLVITKPGFIFDIGFQLSYLAVFAILSLHTVYKKIRLPKNRISRYLCDILFVSIAAQVGVLPLCLYYFHQLPLLFIFSNLIVLPLITIILPLGILVTVFNFISDPIALFLGQLLSFLIEIMTNIITWIASFRTLVLQNIAFNFSMMIALYIVLIALFLWIQKRIAYRLIFLLTSIFLFQIVYWITIYDHKHHDDFVVFHDRKHTLIALKRQHHIITYSNDSLIDQNYNLRMYCNGLFHPSMVHNPLRNTFSFHRQKILVIDSDGIYQNVEKPDIILLINNPKINPDRLLQLLQPKLIIADGTNSILYTERWETSCRKTKIPFYATGKKGFLSIANIN
ncbi:ComEC/Rec2 family competence protein [Flavobacterium cerinum]|uniref:ComEC family competence protein n=1 Tax=Flavobacterium cerinum TaxID=2502784 RepID=A0ABY5ISR4_9FLAO|nr:ComEC/Rec2 family competence protein [Flavobacterium cerinum]UUC45835.1 ComEC family competence protein [Flavobacterium cerinum]